MSYPKIIAKKIRMCTRFGHLSESEGSRRVLLSCATYYCQRCGSNVPRVKAGAA